MTVILMILAILNIVGLVVLFFKLAPRPTTDIRPLFDQMTKDLERTERLLRDEIAVNRGELIKNLQGFSGALNNQLNVLTQMNEQKSEKLREVVEKQLKHMQEDNASKLEKMRETVDEKLHSTLEKRLGESFKMVSDRLEKVHQGLGEMQSLASGVGDLKKMLGNVKTRGAWGEAQLGNLLEQILSPDQYERNCITKAGSRDPVEFVVKMPGQGNGSVLMPIDAKFPTEDYERILAASDRGDPIALEAAAKALEARIKLEAKNIREKYLEPPTTTDFAILFLPIEGLYAEVLRRPGLADTLRRDFNVVVTGPTTIVAFLNSLQMGFRTMAVQQRAGEVWKLLGDIKRDFGKFGDVLEKTKEKLDAASKNIDDAARQSRTIERRMRDVQELPNVPSGTLIEP